MVCLSCARSPGIVNSYGPPLWEADLTVPVVWGCLGGCVCVCVCVWMPVCVRAPMWTGVSLCVSVCVCVCVCKFVCVATSRSEQPLPPSHVLVKRAQLDQTTFY